jgi:hypothetical protein
MKTNIGKFICLSAVVLASLTLVCGAPLGNAAGLDLGLRRAVYITGAKTAIDLKSDKYVGANSSIRVKKSDAVSCQGDKCTFNLGILAFRSDGRGTLSTYGQFAGKNIGIVGNTIAFTEGEKIKQQVLPVKLTVGRNELSFTIDPNKKTAESDENNNEIAVTIVVEP